MDRYNFKSVPFILFVYLLYQMFNDLKIFVYFLLVCMQMMIKLCVGVLKSKKNIIFDHSK